MLQKPVKFPVVFIAVIFLHNLCISHNALAQPQPPNPAPASRTPELIDKEITERMAEAQASFFPLDYPAAQAEPVRTPSKCTGRVAYHRGAIENAISARKKLLIASLSTLPEASALIAYISDEFPTAVRAESKDCFREPVVDPDELVRVEQSTRRFLATYYGTPNALKQVVIISSPTGAIFTYTPKGGGQTETTMTNTTLEYFWRGRYRYTVNKDGYLLGAGELTILNGQEANIVCILKVAEGGVSVEGNATHCVVKK